MGLGFRICNNICKNFSLCFVRGGVGVGRVGGGTFSKYSDTSANECFSGCAR